MCKYPLTTTKHFIIENYYAIMLTGIVDDREIEKLTKHRIKRAKRIATHHQPLKIMSFKISKKLLLKTSIVPRNTETNPSSLSPTSTDVNFFMLFKKMNTNRTEYNRKK